MPVIGLIWALTVTSILSSMIIFNTWWSSESHMQPRQTCRCAQWICRTTVAPVFSLWPKPLRPLTRCTFKASILILLSWAAPGIRSFQTYPFILAMRFLPHADPWRHRALSWIQNLLATHFMQRTSVGLYIHFPMDKPIGPTARKSVQGRLLYHL